MLDPSRRALLYGLLGTLSLAFFVLDVVLPPALTVELAQVAIVLLTLFAEGRRITLIFGGVTTMLVGAGYAAHVAQGEPTAAAANHGIIVLGLGMAVAVVLAYKHTARGRRESEARARAVLDTTIEGIFTIDAEGTIESFNPAAEDIFGDDAAAVLGEPVTTLLAPSCRGTIETALRTYAESGHASLVGTEAELTGQRRDGTTFPMELSLSAVESSGRLLFTGVARDITERKRDERRLRTQYLTAQALTKSDALSAAAPRLLQIVCEELNWQRGEFWTPTAEGDGLQSAAVWQKDRSAPSALDQETRQTTLAPDDGLVGRVWTEQCPQWCPGPCDNTLFVQRDALNEMDVRSGFAFPVCLADRVLGVMAFYAHDDRAMEEGLVQMFAVIRRQLNQFVERRDTENTLQKTAERLERAQEVAGLGSWEYNLDTESLVWSDQMYRLFGVSPEAFSPTLTRAMAFLDAEDRERLERALEEVEKGASSLRLEHRLEPSDGAPRWMLTQAEVRDDNTRLVGTTLDITELKQTKQALEESEARAQAILETTVDGIITIDKRGTVESFNQAAEEIFGYDADEVIGENIKMLMPSPYHEEHDEYLRRYHETGERNIIGIGREVTGRRKDGSTFPMDLAVSEVELGDRTIFTGIVRDISERRQLEKEILNVSDQERRRIGQDLHDGLGQMLTGIGLLSQDLARQLKEEGHDRADDMEEITEHVKEADQYARDLSHGLIPVDVESNGLPEALRRLSANAEQLFDVECEFQEVDTALIDDNATATHLYRIAQEAVNNAVRHGEADHITLRLAAGDEQIRLQVRDDGTGFDDAEVEEGGMGIHIMSYRARIVGGTLDMSSTLGDGTTVTCTLPKTTYTGGDADAVEAPSVSE